MNVRRVVIATDPSGRSVVASDEASPRAHDFVNTPGFGQALVWTTAPAPDIALRWG